MSHEKINDVAVVGMLLEAEHTEVPRAYVVPAPGIERNEKTAQEIVDWHAKNVANHKKLRGGVRFVDEIPKSAAGKILRRLLKVKMEEEKKEPKAKL
jgi:4-coumarate--CoA ligase